MRMYRSEGYLLIRVVIALAAANETARLALPSYRDRQASGVQRRRELERRPLAAQCPSEKEAGAPLEVAEIVA